MGSALTRDAIRVPTPTIDSPDAAVDYVAGAAVNDLGYEAGAVWRECPVLTTANGKVWRALDLAVFGNSLTRGVPEDCCIGVQRAAGHDLDTAGELLKDSGAGFQVLVGEQTWRFREDPDGDMAGPLALADLPAVLAEKHDRLLPGRLLEVKRYRQQYLFDHIFPVTHSKLVEVFEESCRRGYAELPTEKKQQRQYHQMLCALALRVLCLQVLNHRGLLQGAISQPLQGAQRSCEDYATAWRSVQALPDELAGIRDYLRDPSFAALGQDVAAAVFASLGSRREYDFSSVTPEMLGPFYQRALMTHPRTGNHDRQRQRESGVFYTSPRICNTIVERLPLEEIEPERRFVLDPTCGSGSFLRAAGQRLAELVRPRTLSRRERVSMAQTFLQGNDRDPFAIEVAKLEMAQSEPSVPLAAEFTMVDLDIESIRRGDREIGLPCRHRPTIIIGNPPFKRMAKTEERAALLMQVCIENWLSPGGLAGLVMPATFLSGGGRCKSVREYILANCELLELWDLPRGILSDPAFRENGTNGNVSADIETCAVLLRKRAARTWCRVFGVGRTESQKERFRHAGAPTTHGAFLPRAQSQVFGGGRWPTSAVADVLARLADSDGCTPLSSICQVWNGVQRSPEQPVDEPRHADDVPWLQSAQGAPVYAYCRVGRFPATRYVRYPGKMRWPRLRWAKRDSETGAELPDPDWRARGIFAGRKILVRANMDPTGRRFARGFIDTGHYPSNSFHFVWIDPRLSKHVKWNYEALLAIINGPVCDAWLSVARTLTNPVDLLRRVPVPKLDRGTIVAIAKMVRPLLRMTDPAARAGRINDIRAAVLDLYPLSAADRKRIGAALSGLSSTSAETNWIDEAWPIHGVVESIGPPSAAGPAQIVICVPGFRQDRRQYAGDIPPAMPGWSLRAGAEFQAEIPWSDAQAGVFDPDRVRRFRPLPFAYERQDTGE